MASCQDSVNPVTGDVTLGAMFWLNDLESGSCGDIGINSLQSVVTLAWFLNRLNEADYIPGVRLGLEVHRTCKMPERAATAALKLINKYTMEQNVSATPLLGIVGPERTADATVVSSLIASLPAEQRILQISGSSTGRQLSDHVLHPNFFRVIPPDNIQVQVMVQLLERLNWNYVAIVYDDDGYGRSAALELRRLAEEREICVPVYESLPLDTGTEGFSKQANHIAEEMATDPDNGLVRGMIILASARTTQELVRIIAARFRFINLILSESIELQASTLMNTRGHVFSIARGALVTSPKYYDVPEFRTFWNELWTNRTLFEEQASRNPWLAACLTHLITPVCDQDDEGCWDKTADQRNDLLVSADNAGDKLSIFQWYHLKAAGVMATLLKHMHKVKCQGVSGLCGGLRDAIAKRTELQAVLEQGDIELNQLEPVLSAFGNVSALSFDENGNEEKQEGETQYTVYNFQDDAGAFVFKQVGNLSQDALSMNTEAAVFYTEEGNPLTWPERIPAQCASNHDCTQCEHDVSGDVIFMEGDFYVVAIAPIHSKDPRDALKCGEILQVAGADLAQSAVFAVNHINTRQPPFTDILPGRRVGLLAINSCSNPLLVTQRLLDLHTGKLVLPDGRNTSTIVPKIMGYVGALISDSSMAAAETLTGINKPFVQISPASTSADLKNRKRYPYFMRLVPADDTQAMVILAMMARLRVNYVQILYDESTAYATGLLRAIESLGGRYNVCIAQSIPVPQKETFNEYYWILDRLRTKSSAKVVIVFQFPPEIDKIMKATLPRMTPSDDFIFVGTDSWARRHELIDGHIKLAGSLVLAQELAVNQQFKQNFSSEDPTSSVNPWLKYFWESRGNCYFDRSFLRKGKTGPCSKDFARDYVQDAVAPLYINSVYALVLGFSQAMTEHCNQYADSKCGDLTSAAMVDVMKEVELDLYNTGRPSKLFDSNGDGLVGYKVLQVTRDWDVQSERVVYKDVGNWTHEGLVLNTEDLWFPGGAGLHSVCPNDFECSMCFNRSAPNGSQARQIDTSTDVHVGVPVGLSVFFVIVIAVLVVFIVILRRRRLDQGATSHVLRGGAQAGMVFHYGPSSDFVPSLRFENASCPSSWRDGSHPVERHEDESPYDRPIHDDALDDPVPCGPCVQACDYITPIEAEPRGELW